MRLGEAFFHFEAKITLHDYIPSTIVKTGKFPINNSDFKKRRKWRTREHKQENQEKSHSSVFAKNPIIDSIPSRFQPGYRRVFRFLIYRVFAGSLGSGFDRFYISFSGKGMTPAEGSRGTRRINQLPCARETWDLRRGRGIRRANPPPRRGTHRPAKRQRKPTD